MSSTNYIEYIINEDDESSIISSSFFNSPNKNVKQKDVSIFTDFNTAFNEVFNRDCQIEIEAEEEENIDQNDILEPAIYTLSEGNIIPEITNVVIKKPIFKEKKEKNFPFHTGSGLIKVVEDLGLTMTQTPSGRVGVSIYKDKKFETKIMMKDKSGKMKKIRKRRKFKPDNIRKKIKARFHKDLRKIINSKLKKSGSSQLFDLLPQSFITNITIKLNKKILGITYGQLLKETCFDNSSGKEKEKKSDKEKMIRNEEVIKYLLKNKEISKMSEFDKIKNMKYEDLLRAYFTSAEFEKSLIELINKNKNEKTDYIEEYINKAISYVDFFKNI